MSIVKFELNETQLALQLRSTLELGLLPRSNKQAPAPDRL